MNNDNVNNNNKNNNNAVLAMLELPTLYELFFNIIILNIALDIKYPTLLTKNIFI